MKLYTEEQVRKAIEIAQEMDKVPYTDNDYTHRHNEQNIIQSLTPIELPSDEEIAKYMTSVWFADNMHRECFKLGAIWMKTQILNQNL